MQSGSWSSAATWQGGQIPTANHVVRIVLGDTVTIADTSAVAYTIAVDGTLAFAPTVNTRLKVTNLQVMAGEMGMGTRGVLEVGTTAAPIAANVTAEIVIANSPLGGSVADPFQFGTGLIAFGKVSMHGSERAPTFVRLATEPHAGDTALTLSEAISGWKIGDRLVLPDTRHLKESEVTGSGWVNAVNQWEERTVQAISADGTTLTLNSALQYDHLGARDLDGVLDFLPHVGNLTRNVIIRSENPVGTRGHTLSTHVADVDIRHVLFKDLGRTTYLPLNSTTNHIGRYPIHMHHLSGPLPTPANGYQFTLVGNAVDGGSVETKFKWGIAVHGSHYGLIQDNVVYNYNGAAVATEDGSESFNLFDHNFALRGMGQPNDEVSQARSAMGTEGVGFWFRGPNNYVINNVAANYQNPTTEAAYGFVYQFLFLNDIKVPNFPGADTFMATGQSTTRNGNNLPLLQFENNEAYGAMQGGLTYWWVGSEDPVPFANAQESVIQDLKLWNIYNKAVYMYPGHKVIFDGLKIRGSFDDQSRCCGNGVFAADYSSKGIIIRNSDIQGMEEGITAPEAGFGPEPNLIIENSYLRNIDNVVVPTNGSVNGCWMDNKLIVISNTRFAAMPGQNSFNIEMVRDVASAPECLNKLSEARVYAYNGVVTDNFQIYHRNTSVFPRPPASCTPTTRPEILDGLLCPIAPLGPVPPTANLSVSPASISAGLSATLAWSSTNAITVTIDQGIGAVAPSGTRSVSPMATTTYTLTATNAAGSVTETASVTVTPATNLNNRDRANAYDDAWQTGASGWVANAQAILAGATGQVPGLVLWIGDSLTRDPALGAWAQGGAGKTAEDQMIANWMHAGASPQSIDSIDGFALATPYLCPARSYTVGDGLGSWHFMGASSMPADTNPTTARQKLQDCTTYPGALNLTTMLAALPKAQFAIPEVNLDAANPGSFPDFERMVDLMISKGIVPIIITYTYRTDAAFNQLVDQYNAALIQYAQTKKLPLIDLNREMLARVPFSQWPGRFLSDGVHYTGGTSTYPSTSDPYANGGNPATHTTGIALTYDGYGLKGWLGVQKMKEIKQLVVDGLPPSAPTATLSASPASITAGAATTLTWWTSNAATVSIDQGIGAVAVSGTLSVSPTATTTYTLTATNVTDSVTATATVTVSAADTTSPVISEVASSSLTTSGATIGFATNEPSYHQVEYGPTAAYGTMTPLHAMLMTSHSEVLTGLTAGSLYHYRVRAIDAAGNSAMSGDFTFTTPLIAPPSSGLTVGTVRSVNGSNTVSAGPFNTAAGDLVLAFATAAGPQEGGQDVTISGGSLTWTRVTQAEGMPGVVEIWQAFSPTAQSGISVTSTLLVSGFTESLTVVTFSGAAGVGASAGVSGPNGGPSVSLTTTRPGSLLYAAGNDWDGAVNRTLGPNQSMTHQWANAGSGDTYWVQKYNSPVASAGTLVELNDTAPTDHRWNFAAVEVLAATVEKTTPVITWPTPAAITYGTALGETQLNATAAAGVAGTFVYTPASGIVLGAGAGQTLSVTFAPTDTATYNPATATVTIDVLKATALITWPTPAAITYGTALGETQLNATAAAGVAGTFVYTPASGIVLGAGAGQTLSVTFAPTNTANYNTTTQTVAITVLKATPVITWAPPASIVHGTALSGTQLNATAVEAGAFIYTPPSGTVLGVGVGQTLSVTFTPTNEANYKTVTATVAITVSAATPQILVNGIAAPSTVSVSQGEPVAVAVAGAPGNSTDWIGLFRAGTTHPSFLDWNYLSGSRTPGPAGATTASMFFTMPNVPGSYELRLFANNGFTLLAMSTTIQAQPPPTLSINDVSVTEGNSGTAAANFTVTLAPASTQTVTVAFATANGTATAGSDYAAASGTLTFGPGITTQTVTVTVTGDTVAEPSETVLVNLSAATNGVVGDAQGVVTIVNDDAPSTPSIGALPGTVIAGGQVTVTVANGPRNPRDWVGLYLIGGADRAYLDWWYVNGTKILPATGIAGSIFPIGMPMTPGSYELRFLENNTFTRLATSGSLMVAAPPTLSINDVSVTEGNSGTTAANFTVTLAPASTQTVTVAFATANGTATAGSDYAAASGTLTFGPGITTQTITVTVTGDTVAEPNETYVVNLSAATNGVVGDAQGVGTIVTDDAPSTPSIGALPGTVIAGGQVTVTVANGPRNPRDWIGLYLIGAEDRAYLDWWYVNGTKSLPATGIAGATFPAGMPTTPGSYEFRFLENNSFTRLATSGPVTVTVTAPPSPTISVAPGTVNPGERATVTAANGPRNPRDWIGLYLIGAADRAYLAWWYVDGTQVVPVTGIPGGVFPVDMPMTPGSYEFRFFENNTFTRLATSGAVMVQVSPALSIDRSR